MELVEDILEPVEVPRIPRREGHGEIPGMMGTIPESHHLHRLEEEQRAMRREGRRRRDPPQMVEETLVEETHVEQNIPEIIPEAETTELTPEMIEERNRQLNHWVRAFTAESSTVESAAENPEELYHGVRDAYFAGNRRWWFRFMKLFYGPEVFAFHEGHPKHTSTHFYGVFDNLTDDMVEEWRRRTSLRLNSRNVRKPRAPQSEEWDRELQEQVENFVAKHCPPRDLTIMTRCVHEYRMRQKIEKYMAKAALKPESEDGFPGLTEDGSAFSEPPAFFSCGSDVSFSSRAASLHNMYL